MLTSTKKEECPVCNVCNVESDRIKPEDCWACKGSGYIIRDEDIHISEKEIRAMFSALEQR